MWPYLAITSSFSFIASLGGKRRPHKLAWLLAAVILTIFVGLRHRVGADWSGYLYMIAKVPGIGSIGDFTKVAEPFYTLLLVWSDWTGYGIYAADLVAAAVVIFGLFRFARVTPEPWLAVVAALSFHVLVAAISFNRQAMAAGILMWLVSVWHQKDLKGKVFWIFVASGFHYSALAFLAFAGVELRIRLLYKATAIFIFAAITIYILQRIGQLDYYNTSFVSKQTARTTSTNAPLQVSLLAIPALMYYVFPNHRRILFPTTLFRNMAFLALALFPMAFVASTAAGRLSLYLVPFALYAWSALPQVFIQRSRALVRVIICLLMIGINATWLLFANNAFTYIPYRNALLVEPWELDIR